MIVGDLAQLRNQAALTPNLETAIAYLQKSGQDDLPIGNIAIDGDKVFVEVQAYDSIEGPITPFEGHRKYIDIQYVAAGEEIIGWAPLESVSITKAYDAEHDFWNGEADPARISLVRLRAGMAAIMLPSDAHAPRHASNGSIPVRKLVVKVAIEG